MLAAMAAFKDSTPTVGMETAAATGRHSPETPWASLPMIRAHRPVRSEAVSGVAAAGEPAGMAANSLIPFCRSVATAVTAAMPGRKAPRKGEPAEGPRGLGLGRPYVTVRDR